MGHYSAYQPMHNGVPERREKGAKRIFEEMMAEKIPRMMKDMDLHIQKAQWTRSMVYLKTSTVRNYNQSRRQGEIPDSSKREASHHNWDPQ